MTLPVLFNDGVSWIVEADTGEVVALREASDRTLAAAAEHIAALDAELFAAKRALALELRQRYGVGRSHAGGYSFTIGESVSWPVGATQEALDTLVAAGHISEADAKRAMPEKPKPDARQLKALAGRLAVSNPEAAKILVEACTTSPPSLRDVQAEAVEAA